MKPIELTIKGINSYSEEQTVDFTELTKEGIFGIFGPTGSGKSTILDGITLALYGELARKSKNFIHVGSDTASVSFTFSITEKERKVYRVDRTFKVKKDTGYSVAAKARLCELTGDAADVSGNVSFEKDTGDIDAGDGKICREIVLADSISGVKECIQKIVGLEFDDFTRTVVLPQGKFSEFLKLSGSDRNQMLERLFHLYDYGIALTDKVKCRMDENQLRLSACVGKLAEHVGENEEAYRALEEELFRKKKEQEAHEVKLQALRKEQETYKDLWERRKALDEKLQEFYRVEEQKKMAEADGKLLDSAQRAAIVRPFWEQKQRAERTLKQTRESCRQSEEKLYEKRTSLEQLSGRMEDTRKQKLVMEDGYQEKLQKLGRICELEKQQADRKQELDGALAQLEQKKQQSLVLSETEERQSAQLEEKQRLLRDARHIHDTHIEEVVRIRLQEQMEQSGICPVCGQAYHGKGPVAEIHQDNTEESAFYQRMEQMQEQVENLEQALARTRQEQTQLRVDIAQAEGSSQSVQQLYEQQNRELDTLMEACGITGEPMRHKQELEKAYRDICSLYDRNKEQAKQQKEALTELEIRHAGEQARMEEQEKTAAQTQKQFLEKLSGEGFDTEEQMRQSFWEQERINATKDRLRECEKQYDRLLHEVELLKARAGERTATAEEYQRLCTELQDAQKQAQIENEQIAVCTERMERMKEALGIVAGLEQEKKELEHTRAMLNELMTLFKGKKFVEYVAGERLHYVAGEASQKLMEITGGAYGLELKENGEFVIRDYKNGGTARNVNSLSGGEMFLVSLSLALALSTQIQLKGTAPLEFFFLDEGFGTLDDTLLDTVMDSLDALHHDRRKIGIISHVDAIKERVPVKLIVIPAKAGEGGSRIEIVRSYV